MSPLLQRPVGAIGRAGGRSIRFLRDTFHWLGAFGEAFRRWTTDGVFSMSASVAFYAAFAMVPSLLILISLVGLFYGADAAARVEAQVSLYVGESAATMVARAVGAAAGEVEVGAASTALAVAMILISSSALFAEVQDAMNTVWRVRSRPGRGIAGVLRDRFWPFTMLAAASALLLVSFVLSTFIQAYSVRVNRIVPGAAFLWHWVDLGLSLAVTAVLFTFLYKFLPDAWIAWSDVWVGGIVTAVLFAGGKYLFTLYLATTAIESVYGAAGSLLVILIWVYFSTAILLLGAEFTHVYADRHGHRVRPKPNAVSVD